MDTKQAIAKAAIAYLPVTYKRTLELVGEEPASVEQIAAHVGMTIGAAYKMIAILKQLKVLCVVDYPRIHPRGPWTKLYGIGSKDKSPPQKVTGAERSAKCRAAKKPKLLAPFTIGAYANASTA